MDEAQALQPDVVRRAKLKTGSMSTEHMQHFGREISMSELREHNGQDGKAVWLSLGGRVLDASRSSSYAPGDRPIPDHYF